MQTENNPEFSIFPKGWLKTWCLESLKDTVFSVSDFWQYFSKQMRLMVS